jgi:hypothetical protein
VLSLGLPSGAKVARYLGAFGVVIYLLTLVVVVIGVSRLGVVTWPASIPPRRASALTVATLAVLVAAFVAIYPRVTSCRDRDEALDLAGHELLRPLSIPTAGVRDRRRPCPGVEIPSVVWIGGDRDGRPSEEQSSSPHFARRISGRVSRPRVDTSTWDTIPQPPSFL